MVSLIRRTDEPEIKIFFGGKKAKRHFRRRQKKYFDHFFARQGKISKKNFKIKPCMDVESTSRTFFLKKKVKKYVTKNGKKKYFFFFEKKKVLFYPFGCGFIFRENFSH